MTESELEAALILWGRYYGERPPPDWSDSMAGVSMAGAYGRLGGSVASSDYGTNPIATAMQYGSRRQAHNVAAYARPRDAVRHWRDPVAGKETRVFRGALHFAGAVDTRIPSLAGQVEREAVALYRVDTLRGLVLRANYCKRGSRVEKAAWVSAQPGVAVTARTFRDVLAHARTWMQARLTGDVIMG